MKNTLRIWLFGFVFAFLVAACGSQTNSDSIFDEADTWLNPVNTPMALQDQADTVAEIVEGTNLSGEINIIYLIFSPTSFESSRFIWHNVWLEWRDFYAARFSLLHPDVTINFEFIPYPTNLIERTAFNVRLMADPPDILVFRSDRLIFEKMNLESLFVDMYDFFHGPRGIDLDNYFSNIFKAAEMQSRLFHVPVQVGFEFLSLNTRLFDGIGVDISQRTVITMDEKIDYFLRIVYAFPDERLFLSDIFSLMHMLSTENLYDLDTAEVFVSTPEMRSIFERARYIPTDPNSVTFTPDGFEEIRWVWGGAMATMFLQRYNRMAFFHRGGPLSVPIVGFVSDHPNSHFSHPILFVDSKDQRLGFSGARSFAILNNANDKDLAWEFLRFAMEETDCHYLTGQITIGNLYLPINRSRFENQTRSVIYQELLWTWQAGALNHLVTDEEDARLREAMASMSGFDLQFLIDSGALTFEAMDFDAMAFYRNALEQATREIRFDESVMQSLVYPDIWLLYTGQQDVYRTLANIQSRLELYVHE